MFYISSQGHSATGWLASVLSMHPRIVCWHGTRGIPPYPSGQKELSAEDFVEGLRQCERGCLNQKVFGACHGYYGTILKQYVEENKGVFMGLIRNPIMRVNSMVQAFAAPELTYGFLPTDAKIDIDFLVKEKEKLFDEYFPSVADEWDSKYSKRNSLIESTNYVKRLLNQMNLLPLLKKYRITHMYGNVVRSLFFQEKNDRTDRKKKIYFEMRKNKNAIDLKLIKETLTDSELSQAVISNFLAACYRTFTSDSVITTDCEKDFIIKMEEMTMSPGYFDNKIFVKIMNRKAENKYLNQVFGSTDHINRHSPIHKSPIDIFESWPGTFRNYFMKSLLSCKAMSIYKEYGYEVADLQ